MKMHLTARPANEGARRLATWVGRVFSGNLRPAAIRLGMPATTLQRVLEGAIIPGECLVEQIGRGTLEYVSRADFRQRPRGGWFDVLDILTERRAA